MYIRTSSFVSLETPLQFIACIPQGFVDPKCNSSNEDIPYIVDGIERGMFPDLTTVRCYEIDSERTPIVFKLLKANIFLLETGYFHTWN